MSNDVFTALFGDVMQDGRLKVVTELEVVECANCHMVFGVPAMTLTRRRKDGKGFYCPNGHSNVYSKSETDKLKDELEETKRRLAREQSLRDQDQARAHTARREADHQARRAAAARGQVTKIKNRVGAGVCPCCNRQFQNLARHMAGQHPDWAATESREAA